MATPEQELELLRLKVKIMELEQEKALRVSGGQVVTLVNDEPAPIASPTGVSNRFITREELDKLTPGELFILAAKKGIPVTRIFPI